MQSSAGPVPKRPRQADLGGDGNRASKLRAELQTAAILEEKIANCQASLCVLKNSRRPRMVPGRIPLTVAKDSLKLYKESLADVTSDYQQMRLMVNRLQLSWASLNALVPKKAIFISEKEQLQAALRKRDSDNEMIVQLVRDISYAQQRRSRAEAACRTIQLRNRKLFNQLASPALANSTSSWPQAADAKERIVLRNLLTCVGTGSELPLSDELCAGLFNPPH